MILLFEEIIINNPWPHFITLCDIYLLAIYRYSAALGILMFLNKLNESSFILFITVSVNTRIDIILVYFTFKLKKIWLNDNLRCFPLGSYYTVRVGRTH